MESSVRTLQSKLPMFLQLEWKGEQAIGTKYEEPKTRWCVELRNTHCFLACPFPCLCSANEREVRNEVVLNLQGSEF